jgi:hypothetical protein
MTVEQEQTRPGWNVLVTASEPATVTALLRRRAGGAARANAIPVRRGAGTSEWVLRLGAVEPGAHRIVIRLRDRAANLTLASRRIMMPGRRAGAP